jgi:hypothetical protein
MTYQIAFDSLEYENRVVHIVDNREFVNWKFNSNSNLTGTNL